MTYDTTKDPRVVAANLAYALLKKCLKQKPAIPLKISRDKLSGQASACESAVMTLMYMYQEPQALAVSEPAKNLAEAMALIS